MIQKTQADQIKTFIDLIRRGLDDWITAGEILVAIIDADPEAIDKIRAAHDWISQATLIRFEQIGRHQLLPILCVSDAPGDRQLRAQPYSLQLKYTQEPVELLVGSNGTSDTLQVAVKNLTSAQASQVFGPEGVRDIAQQKAYLADKTLSTAFPSVGAQLPYRIKGNTVQFLKNCTLTAHQLAGVLAKMKVRQKAV